MKVYKVFCGAYAHLFLTGKYIARMPPGYCNLWIYLKATFFKIGNVFLLNLTWQGSVSGQKKYMASDVLMHYTYKDCVYILFL